MSLTMGQQLAIRRIRGKDPFATAADIAMKIRASTREVEAAAGIKEPERMHIPETVISERDRRQALTPRSFTAAWQGDPLPGYSALDKRQGA
jgi:hypothetical protein